MPHTRRPHLAHESGQTLTEYSLLIVLIAIVVAVLLPGVSSTIGGLFGTLQTVLGG
jgi:Flp pilus assembly pilin Flp